MKKEQAIKLRKKGLTYNQISKKLKVPKSTLSYWFKNLSFNEKIKKENYNKAQKIWAKVLTDYNIDRAKKSKEKNLKEQERASKSINQLTRNELRLIGTALYWAEGYKKTKYNIIFSNSDPEITKIIMKFFQEICQVPLNRIKGQVQLHPNTSNQKSTKYWGKISGIPTKQFRKPLITVSKSSKGKRKFNTLPYGTFRIIINDVRIVNLIKGWINGIARQFH